MTSVPEIAPERGPSEHPPRSRLAAMPPVLLGLAIVLVAAHVARILLPAPLQEQIFLTYGVLPARFGETAFFPPSALDWAQALIGHMFLHGGLEPLFGFIHVGVNVMVLLQVGELPARRMALAPFGAWRFLALFFGSGAAGGLAYILINPGSPVPAVGASGAVCGVFTAYLLSTRATVAEALRDRRVLQGAFWFLALNVGLWMVIRTVPIAWEAHLGGFIAGGLLFPLLAPSLRRGRW